jgi:hypothetical protein
VTREDLRRLFAAARARCGETDYVVFGSLAVLGYTGDVPPRMRSRWMLTRTADTPQDVEQRRRADRPRQRAKASRVATVAPLHSITRSALLRRARES